MTTKEVETQFEGPVHVHICASCGKVARRDDPDGVPDVTGIFRCSVCGHEGPLNSHVIDPDDPRLDVSQ
jgi:hypothetical protein